MNLQAIIQQLDQEISKLQTARAALTGTSNHSTPSAGRRGPRKMSAAARKRISEAQKKRWAAQRKK